MLVKITRENFAAFPPRRPLESHKGNFGHLAIIAGSLGFHGAAVLAARGAQRAQPGLVTLLTQEDIFVPVASQLQAAMVHPWSSKKNLPDSGSAILIGPGLAAKNLSTDFKKSLIELWKNSPLPIIADASALDWLPEKKIPENNLRVITPHSGEAARMLKISSTEIQTNREKSLRQLSRRYGNCFVVLKGHQTLIGRSKGKIFLNTSGNPFLAQGGSGDLLSGYLSGLLAQPALQNDPLKTICYAVWQHGAAADRLSLKKPNWTIADLAEGLGL